MQILFYVPYYLPSTRYGGPVRSVHGLAQALVALGHKVTVLTTNVDGDDTLEVPLDQPVQIDGVTVYYFPIQTPRRLYYCPDMARRAKMLIQDIDVVHLNGVFSWPGPSIGRIARRARVPVVISPRGMLMPRLVAGKSRIIKLAWLALKERNNLAQAQALHVTADVEAEGLRALGLDLAPMRVLPNGVEIPPLVTNDEIAAVWGDVPEGRRVLFLGRLGWNKGVDMAIVAVRSHSDAIIYLAGGDEIGLKTKLEPNLMRANGQPCGAFLGQIDGPAKWALISGADIMLVPSLQENFGNVVAEAMAVGTTVIATDGVGASHYLAKLDPGLQIPRNQGVLNTRLAELLADPARRTRITIAGQKLVRDELDWSAIAEAMETVYHGAVACTA